MRAVAIAALAVTLAGCAGTQAPYARGAAPTTKVLLDATQPRMEAIQVPLARVRVRALRANLAYIAQGPDRFRGQIQVAGKELVTLAFHEQAYGMRYLLDAYPQGFYEGQPSPCAVQALIGVPLRPADLVTIVLGGAPVLEGQVVDQRWDRKAARERILIENGTSRQELQFAYAGGGWWLAGATLWQGDERQWTVRHEDFEGVGGVYLPGRTRVSRPGPKRDFEVVIQYRDRIVDPGFVLEAAAEASAGGDGDDDGWEDDEGWEDGEGEPTPAVSATVSEGPNPEDGAVDPAAPDGGSGRGPAQVAPAPPPALFILEPDALPRRGPLCRS